MNKTTRNVLNWILIALVIMLPLRGVMAFDQSACQMHERADGAAITEVVDHSMHAMHVMPADVQQDAANESHDCCCCDSGMNCNGDCGIGLGASFIMQSIAAVPVLNNTAIHIRSSNNPVSRELIPPTRPPASLHS